MLLALLGQMILDHQQNSYKFHNVITDIDDGFSTAVINNDGTIIEVDYDVENTGDFLDANGQIIISNIYIEILDETDNSFLELSVNNHSTYTSPMIGDNYIRIGNPNIESESDNTFISNSGLSDIYNIISIYESQNSASINKDDDIRIIIPNSIGIEWADTSNWQLSGDAAYKINDISFEDNKKIIKFDVTADFIRGDS